MNVTTAKLPTLVLVPGHILQVVHVQAALTHKLLQQCQLKKF